MRVRLPFLPGVVILKGCLVVILREEPVCHPGGAGGRRIPGFVILKEERLKDLALEFQSETLRDAQNDVLNVVILSGCLVVILREDRPKELALEFQNETYKTSRQDSSLRSE